MRARPESDAVKAPRLTSRRLVLGFLAAACTTTPRALTAREGTATLAANIAYTFRDGAAPTIVFESGLGDGLEVWAGVIERLPSSLAFLAYSRPGYGESTPLAEPREMRNSEEAARLLHELLRQLEVRPPYLLVGHSLGGLYIAKYAALYSGDVAGLLFVDGRPPSFRRACSAQQISSCADPPEAPAHWPAHILAERRGMFVSDELAPPMTMIAHYPATIITSTAVWPGEQGQQAFALWLQEQATFANAFRDARLVRAEGTSHYVQRDDPALVVREIGNLAERIAARRHGG